MGGEFAQEREWNYNAGLDWGLLQQNQNIGIQLLIKDLNYLYQTLPALHQLDCDPNGFQWIDSDNHERSLLIYLRKGLEGEQPVLVVVNFTPTPYPHFRLGVPFKGNYVERLNTDSNHYGGSNVGNTGRVMSQPEICQDQPHSIGVVIPPLATVIFELKRC